MKDCNERILPITELKSVLRKFRISCDEDATDYITCPAISPVLGNTGTDLAAYNQTLATGLLNAAERLDMDNLGRFLHPDCRYLNLPLPAFIAANNRTAALRQLRGLSWILTGYEVLEYRTVVAGEKALIMDRSERLSLLGLSCDLHVWSVFEFSDGGIISWTDNFELGAIFVGLWRSLVGRISPRPRTDC